MPTPKEAETNVTKDLLKALDGALNLLEEFKTDNQSSLPDTQNAASLMEQCLALCEQQRAAKSEPIRTVSHFACTGGTLVSKCIAAMPNIQLLSEINPFSTMGTVRDKPSFAPTDIIRQMRQSTRGSSSTLIAEIFLNNVQVIYSESNKKGYHLVLRDHAHSQFCIGAEASTVPTLSDLVSSRFDTLSIVTVRHPVQSFISLRQHKWIHFQPPDFDEYCRRYLVFLRTHANDPIFKYEDLVHDPVPIMRRICKSLGITFSDQFQLLFSTFKLTGDSGRGGETIQALEGKDIDGQLAHEVVNSHHYPLLIECLGYR